MPAQARERALEIARVIIGGHRSMLQGVHALAALRGELCADPLSPTLLAILTAADDTRELPLDSSLRIFSPSESDELRRRIEAAENLHREAVLTACRQLVRKLERA